MKFPTWMGLFFLGVLSGYIIRDWPFLGRFGYCVVAVAIITVLLRRFPALLGRDRADSGHG